MQLDSNKKISEWEQVLGLAETQIAKTGTKAERESQICGWLREHGKVSFADVQTLVRACS